MLYDVILSLFPHPHVILNDLLYSEEHKQWHFGNFVCLHIESQWGPKQQWTQTTTQTTTFIVLYAQREKVIQVWNNMLQLALLEDIKTLKVSCSIKPAELHKSNCKHTILFYAKTCQVTSNTSQSINSKQIALSTSLIIDLKSPKMLIQAAHIYWGKSSLKWVQSAAPLVSSEPELSWTHHAPIVFCLTESKHITRLGTKASRGSPPKTPLCSE